MKRIALLFLFIISSLQYSSAQLFQAGFYAGATMTDIPGTDNIDNDVDFEHLGFTIAGTVSANISPKTKIQMEIRYFQRGAQQNPQIINDSASSATVNPNGQYLNNYFTMTLNYVDVVIGIKHSIHFNLRHATTDRYGIEGGVSVGALVGYTFQSNSITYPLDLEPIDVSPYIGIYYNITPHFYIEGRYSNSVNPVLKPDNANSLNFYNIYYSTWNAGHNVAFSLTLGFNLGNASSQPASDAPAVAPKTDTDN